MKFIKANWHRIVLFLIVALTGFLTYYSIGREGYANEYYSAAVKSMLTSWHNFFFASFDPGGYVTVDKPAMGLWLQAASAYIFGFHGWSVILPEALSTVISVVLVYHLVRRFFGKAAGLVSALVMGVTPILIAVSRTNNLDASLVMVLLFAAWALITAAERGSLRLLILSMALVGLGFNIKMLQAFMVLPAFYLVYLFTSNRKILNRVLHLTAATAVLLAVSLSWAVIVDLTPADSRPYIGSSQANSVLELALGYNGIQRLTGTQHSNGGGAFQRNDGNAGSIDSSSTPGSKSQGNMTPPDGFNGNGAGGPGRLQWNGDGRSFRGFDGGRGGPGMNGGGGFNGGGPGGTGENGAKGILRVFDQQIAGQISWLLPMALFGILALILRICRKDIPDRRKAARYLLLFAAWIVPMLVFFSIGGFFHRYYLSMLAPAIAALTGIGILEMWKLYMESGWKWAVLPAAIITNAAVQGVILYRYTGWREVLIPIVCGLSLFSTAVLVIIRLLKKDSLVKTIKAATAAALAALLLSPAIWACTPLVYGSQSQLPIAGPELNSGNGGWNNHDGNSMGPSEQSSGTSQLVNYLISKRTTERYLVAVPDAGTAESIILRTGQPVMAIGGFSGSDNILTVEKLKEMVKNGEIRYFEAGGRGMGSQSEITNWVMQNGKEVSSSEWTGSSSSTDSSSQSDSGWFGGRMDNNVTLYDLAPEKG